MKLPCVSLREKTIAPLYAEENCVTGAIDVGIGQLSNGSKQHVKIEGTNNHVQTIFFGSTAEAKNIGVRLSGGLPGSRKPRGQELKTMYQPITELCAM